MRDRDRRYILPDAHPLLANLAALWKSDPRLALRVEQALDATPDLCASTAPDPSVGRVVESPGKSVGSGARSEASASASGASGASSKSDASGTSDTDQDRSLRVVAAGLGPRVAACPRQRGPTPAATPSARAKHDPHDTSETSDRSETPGTSTVRFPEDFDPAEQFGFAVSGFGPHVNEVFERTGGTKGEAIVAVFAATVDEVAAELGRTDYSQTLSRGRVALFAGTDDVMGGRVADRLKTAALLVSLGFTQIVDEAAVERAPAFFGQVAACLGGLVSQQRTLVATAVQHGRKTSVNVLGNLREYAANAGLGRLKNAFAGCPAVIVSAGPSLRKNIAQLRGREGEFVIIAVQTALKPLLEAGVVPQFVCSIDHHEISTRFYGDLPADLPTELVAEPKAAAATIQAWRSVPGRKLTLLGNGFAESALRELGRNLPTLPPGATVAHLAFALAEHFGCRETILIGQDLGFSDGLAYAPGTGYDDAWRPETGRFCTFEMKQWEHIARDRHALIRVADWQGNATYTEQRLAAYLAQFEQMFANTPMRVIDATEGGVAKRFTEAMPLSAALSACDRGPAPAVPVFPEPIDNAEQVKVCLAARAREAAVLADVSRRTLPFLETIREHPGDPTIVNAAVAKVDALRRELSDDRDVDRTYLLAADLTQQSERDRYLADVRIRACGLDDTERLRRQAERDLANVRAMLAAAEDLQRLVAPTAEKVAA